MCGVCGRHVHVHAMRALGLLNELFQEDPPAIFLDVLLGTIRLFREHMLRLGIVNGIVDEEIDDALLVAHLHCHATVVVGFCDASLAPAHCCPVEEDPSPNQSLGLWALKGQLLRDRRL